MTRVRAAVVRLCARIYQAYYRTLRIVVSMPDGTVAPLSRAHVTPDIFAVCERDTLALGGIIADRRFSTVVAHGRDGDWASLALETFGCRVIRGSTRAGGVAALAGLFHDLATCTSPVAIVVDGPLGPAGVAKAGAVACGIRSGRPVVALGVAATRRLVFPGTWSGIYLPLPFSTIAIAVEPPLDVRGVPPSAAAEHAPALTARLEAARVRAAALPNSRRSGPRRIARRISTSLISHVSRALLTSRDLAVAIVVLPIVAPVWLLPWRAAVRLGRWYGYAVWAVSVRARRVGSINLRRAFGPARSERDIRSIVRQVFGNLGQSIAEGIQFARRTRAQRDWLPPCDSEDPELLRRILADPRPKIFVTGHLGSWELATAIAAVRAARDGAVIYRRVDNRFLDALWRLTRPERQAEWIEKRGAASRAAAALRAGRSVAMLVDENGGYRGVFVPFFGRPASTRKTAAVLSLTTGAPIVVGACVRRPGKPFLFRLAMFEPPAADRKERKEHSDLGGLGGLCVQTVTPDAGQAIDDLTASIVATFEAWIRDDPAQWRWVHWRWKTRPDGTEEQYGRADARSAEALALRPDGVVQAFRPAVSGGPEGPHYTGRRGA